MVLNLQNQSLLQQGTGLCNKFCDDPTNQFSSETHSTTQSHKAWFNTDHD